MLVIEKLCKNTHSFRDFLLKRTWFWAQPVVTFLVKACGRWEGTVWSVFRTHGPLFLSGFTDSLSSKIPRSINRRCWILSLFQIVVHRPHLSLLCWLIGCVLPFSGEKRHKHSDFLIKPLGFSVSFMPENHCLDNKIQLTVIYFEQ